MKLLFFKTTYTFFLFTSYYIAWGKNHEFWEKHFNQLAKREYFQSFKMELHPQALNVLCRICGGGGGGGGAKGTVKIEPQLSYDLKRKIENVCDIDAGQY